MSDTINTVAEALGAPEYFPYTVTDAVEIASILTSLRDRHARASVYFNAQPGSILTSVLAVNGRSGTFVFDIDGDHRRNRALVTAERLAWRTALEGVRIEFGTDAAHFVEFDKGPALEAPIPARLLRLQRRNAYRAPAPASPPLVCLMDADNSGKTVKARVLDISALGLSLLVDSRQIALSSMLPVARLSIDLPGFGEIQCSAEIRYAIEAGHRYAPHFRRCGVQFKLLAAADQVLLQRYVITLERERAKSRLTD